MVLILMLALLPLRSWAVGGMVVRMAQQQVVTAAAGPASMDAMPEDCPMMVQALHGGWSPGEDASADSSHCLSCTLCGASACAPEARFKQGPSPTGPPAASVSRFRSAELARQLRPPNS